MLRPDDDSTVGGLSDFVWISPSDIECSHSLPARPDCYRSTTLRVQGHTANLWVIPDYSLQRPFSETIMKAGFLRGKDLDKDSTKIKIPSGDLKEKKYPAVTKITRAQFPCTLPPNTPVPNEAQSECLLYEGIKESILAIPGFPQPVPVPNPPRYKITPTKGVGVGIGLVATIDLDIGDLIVAERPLIVYTKLVERWAVPPQEVRRLLVERLDLPAQEEYYALRNCKGYSRCNADGIADTNSMTIGELPGYSGVCIAVCKVISRASHR